jgi:hypothetical protein
MGLKRMFGYRCWLISWNGSIASHVFWILLIVKQNVAANPLDIAVFSAIGVMFESDGIAHLV